ncbi:hypothetical protein NE865_04659 [Phthorimaea operculella]|nr:hypothetical protein NE865_04659 [Phthorimaea operculella]
MRSQATKPLPKKGTAGKTAVKANSVSKPPKKKGVAPKKVKSLANKTLLKNAKKSSKDSKDDVPSGKSEEETSSSDKSDTSSENIKSGPSKGSTSRSNSPTKKPKKETKATKISQGPKGAVSKKIVKKVKKSKSEDNRSDNEDDVKYKINLDVAKKSTSKFSKAKTIIKRSNLNQKKKVLSIKKPEKAKQESEENQDNKEKESDNNKEAIGDDKKPSEIKEPVELQLEKKEDSKCENANNTKVDPPTSGNSAPNPPPSATSETPKVETERPPKFFTSSRSPRVVDIDVKLCKNSKGNLSVSERFMKCETKTEESNKDKAVTNTLVSQGPEVDVYTFTEKVDSPKSILSDFRSPMNKNIGRVRPIARVKGTVIDKKDPEKKKYSPHRPIEEVVKQLKAKKGSEDLSAGNKTQDSEIFTSADCVISDKDSIENPQPIVSKSYKMVARKSSITGKPFSPSFGLDQDESSSSKTDTTTSSSKKPPGKTKKQKKISISDDEFESCKFAFNTKSFHYSSSEESVNSAKKTTSKELRELSKDSLIDLKDEALILGGDKPSKRRLKLLSMWTGPKKHRMASLNAIAKVHCLYENESRTHMELGLMRTVDRQIIPSTSKSTVTKKKETKPKEEKQESTSESEYENKTKDKKEDSSESSDDNPPQRSLRGDPGIRSAGKYWDPKSCTSSSEDSELESKKKVSTPEKKKSPTKTSSTKSDSEKPPAKMKKTAGVPVKKKRNRNEVVMDLKDMVVQKRMASLNATAILAASYEKRSPKSSKDDTTSDSCSDESFSQKSKNVVASGVKSEIKHEDTKKDIDDTVMADSKQKVEVIVNQESDVTITGVYSTHHHEGFCTVSGMQYRISSTSHTQTTATANCEKEGCARDEARYTPLTALSSMQPPADHVHAHPGMLLL